MYSKDGKRLRNELRNEYSDFLLYLPLVWTRIVLGILILLAVLLCIGTGGWYRLIGIISLFLLVGYGLAFEVAVRKHFSNNKVQLYRERFMEYAEWMPVPAMLVNMEGHILAYNAAFREKSGQNMWAESSAASKLFDESSERILLSSLSKVKSANTAISVQLTSYHSSGFIQDWHATITPTPVSNHACIYMQDNSSKRHLEDNLHYMSYYDDTTGLPNRRLFLGKLEEVIGMAKQEHFSLSVLYMDLDRFKRINDNFGSDFGDMLLMLIADRLLRVMTENDMLARMDSDEFACFMTYMPSEETVTDRVHELLEAMEEPFVLNDIPVHVTMSIGVVHQSGELEPDTDVTSLLKHADSALAEVKQRGKNSYLFFGPEMDTKSLDRLTLEHELLKGLNEQQFELYYQPQVDILTKQIVGVEALVRWNHPVRGLVSPAEFIPLAEENGFIIPLGSWVLEQACMQNRRWQEEGLPRIPVSVNLSVRQFEQNDLIQTVANALELSSLDAQYLDVEITESMTLDVKRALRILKELKDMGVSISVDDFGTGYSSLHYLKNFPIHRLKIDRSFVRDLELDPNDAAIVSAIIALGHKMNLQVIAEGVETEAQVSFLQEHACDELQGYFFSPPVPSHKLEQLLRVQIHN